MYWLLANDKAESKPTSTEQDGSVRVDETEVLMAKTAADQTETKHQLPVNQRRPQGLVSLPSILIDVYFFVICQRGCQRGCQHTTDYILFNASGSNIF